MEKVLINNIGGETFALNPDSKKVLGVAVMLNWMKENTVYSVKEIRSVPEH